jgi:hypothetical protein
VKHYHIRETIANGQVNVVYFGQFRGRDDETVAHAHLLASPQQLHVAALSCTRFELKDEISKKVFIPEGWNEPGVPMLI